MGAIKRQVEDESKGELCREQDVAVEVLTVETDLGAVEEEMNNFEDSIGDTEVDLSEEHPPIVEQLKEIMVEERIGDEIIFKKVDKKVFRRSSI